MKEASGRWKTSEVPRSGPEMRVKAGQKGRITAGSMEKKRWLLEVLPLTVGSGTLTLTVAAAPTGGAWGPCVHRAGLCMYCLLASSL